jgi:hypothetical protein
MLLARTSDELAVVGMSAKRILPLVKEQRHTGVLVLRAVEVHILGEQLLDLIDGERLAVGGTIGIVEDALQGSVENRVGDRCSVVTTTSITSSSSNASASASASA